MCTHSDCCCCRRFLWQTLVGGSYGLLNRSTFEPNPDYYVSLLFKRLMGPQVLPPNITAKRTARSATANDDVGDGARVYIQGGGNNGGGGDGGGGGGGVVGGGGSSSSWTMQLSGRDWTSSDPVADRWVRVFAHCTPGSNTTIGTTGSAVNSRRRRSSGGGGGSGGGSVTLLVVNQSPSVTFDIEGGAQTPALLPRDEYVLTAASLHSQELLLNSKPLRVTTPGSLPDVDPVSGITTHLVVAPHSISFFVLPQFGAEACT
jgi:hypothetical protein